MVYHMNAFFIMCVSFSEKSLSEFLGGQERKQIQLLSVCLHCCFNLTLQLSIDGSSVSSSSSIVSSVPAWLDQDGDRCHKVTWKELGVSNHSCAV